MFGVTLVVLGFFALHLVTTRDRLANPAVAWSLHGAYALRLFLQFFLRDIPFFSYGAGGDCAGYEETGWWFAQIWSHTGYRYMTDQDFPGLGATALPGNIFGIVIYINGDYTRIGCTALVALSACLTCYNLYRLAVELGAAQRFAFRIMLLLLFGPAVLMYTSDTYKDGFVMLFTTGAVASSIRLARRFSLLHLILGAVCIVGLYQVRYYMVFLASAPLLVGIMGFNSRSILRPVIATAVLMAASIAILSYSNVGGQIQQRAQQTFAVATDATTRAANAEGGSGVTFDDGGTPFGAIGPKLAYTLFAPFPWQGGSLGFQIGKLDVFIWYFLAYRAFRAARVLARKQPTLLLSFLVFILPTMVAYATTMANIGLILRQRLPVILVSAVLAALSELEAVEEVEAEPTTRTNPRTTKASRAGDIATPA